MTRTKKNGVIICKHLIRTLSVTDATDPGFRTWIIKPAVEDHCGGNGVEMDKIMDELDAMIDERERELDLENGV